MIQEFVPYKLAVKLKELGFDEECFGSWWFNPSIHKLNEEELQIIKSYYFGLPEYCILAPTFSQAFRWFREKHRLFIQPNRTIDSEGTWYYFSISSKRTDVCEGSFVYEEAELSCLEKLIEIVESKSE